MHSIHSFTVFLCPKFGKTEPWRRFVLRTCRTSLWSLEVPLMTSRTQICDKAKRIWRCEKIFQNATYFTHFNFSHFVFDCFRKESACRADSGRVGLGKRPHAWAKDKQLPSGTDSLSELSDARRSLDHSESVLSSLCSLKNTHPQHDSDYRSLSVFSLTHCSRKLQWQE